MTDHDPLCPLAGYGNDATLCPYCPVVTDVRADERERIAQAIEAHPVRFGYHEDFARIARGGTT